MGAISEHGHCPQLRRGCAAECSVGTMGISQFSTSYGKKPWGGRDLLRAGLGAICLPLPSLAELPPAPAVQQRGKTAILASLLVLLL